MSRPKMNYDSFVGFRIYLSVQSLKIKLNKFKPRKSENIIGIIIEFKQKWKITIIMNR